MASRQTREEDKQQRSGIPKDWVAPNMQLSTNIKFCDMKIDMKEYALQLTQYIYTQMAKTEITYLKDAAEIIKNGFQTQFGGCWHVVCGVNFGSYFNYQKTMLGFQFGNMVDLLYSFVFISIYAKFETLLNFPNKDKHKLNQANRIRQFLIAFLKKTEFMRILKYAIIYIMISCIGCLIQFVLLVVIPLRKSYQSMKTGDKMAQKMWAVYWGLFFTVQFLKGYLPFLEYSPFQFLFMLLLLWAWHDSFKGALFIAQQVNKMAKNNPAIKDGIQKIKPVLGYLKIFQKEEKKKAD